jgi:nitrogen fixation NifU-like protein
MTEKLRQLYQSQILALSKKPHNERELTSFSHLVKAYNPVCGDQYEVYLNIVNDRVLEASFTGYGCAISKASTSVLTKQLIGKELKEIERVIDDFLKILDPAEAQSPEQITDEEELLAFAAAREFPERLDCVNLSWKAVKDLVI